MHGELRGDWLGLLPSFSLLPVLAERPDPRTWYSECQGGQGGQGGQRMHGEWLDQSLRIPFAYVGSYLGM